MIRRTALSLVALAAVGSASAQTPLMGISVGVFMPMDSEMKSLFGDTWFQYGFSPSIKLRNKETDIRPELSILSQSKDGNRLLIVSVPVSFVKRFADENSSSVPYVNFGAGPTFFDYSIQRVGSLTRYDKDRFGWSVHGEVGLVLSNRIRVHTRYVKFSEHDGFRFDGVQLGLSYQFFSL